MKQRKSTVRKWMNHVISEVDNAIILAGGREIDLRLRKSDDGLRLYLRGDFNPDKREDMLRMAGILQPAVKDPALLATYADLTGDDQYTSDSELTLVGHMLDSAKVEVDEREVRMELYIAY